MIKEIQGKQKVKKTRNLDFRSNNRSWFSSNPTYRPDKTYSIAKRVEFKKRRDTKFIKKQINMQIAKTVIEKIQNSIKIKEEIKDNSKENSKDSQIDSSEDESEPEQEFLKPQKRKDFRWTGLDLSKKFPLVKSTNRIEFLQKIKEVNLNLEMSSKQVNIFNWVNTPKNETKFIKFSNPKKNFSEVKKRANQNNFFKNAGNKNLNLKVLSSKANFSAFKSQITRFKKVSNTKHRKMAMSPDLMRNREKFSEGRKMLMSPIVISKFRSPLKILKKEL